MKKLRSVKTGEIGAEETAVMDGLIAKVGCFRSLEWIRRWGRPKRVV